MIRAAELRDLADAACALGLTRARVTQIMNLLLLAPEIQEAILGLPAVTTGRDLITERTVRRIVAEPELEPAARPVGYPLAALRDKRAENLMPVTMEGHKLTLFADRDKSILPALTFRGRVRWFELRMRRMLIRPLDALRPRRRGWKEADLSYLLVFGSVLFNGVEALGSFYRGRDGSQRTFSDFVADFMDPAYRPHIATLRDDFRNGLAHGFAVKNGGFEFLPRGAVHLDPAAGVQIDPDALLRDFKKAVTAYLHQLRRGGDASPIGQAFLRRFRSVVGV